MSPHPSGRDRDWTDTECEGTPNLADQPPGIGSETAEDGLVPARDHPMAVEETGTTQLEQALPETPAERAARERTDLPQAPPGNLEGRLAVGAEDADDLDGGSNANHAGLLAEEAAVHVEQDA